jgi:serine/threonine-protein kinase
MGVVYRVEHIFTKRVCALKLASVSHSVDSSALDRFTREAQVMAQLAHQHIVDVLDAGQIDDRRRYLVMPYIDGPSLEEWLEGNGQASLEWTAAVLGQIALALDAAAAKKIVHRDVKPSNILLDPNDRAWLCDFGIAHVVDGTRHTRTGSGGWVTVPYAAPEQLQNGTVGPATDQYALACVAYECLSGRPPFTGTTEEMWSSHVYIAPEPPSGLRADLPSHVDAAIVRALAKEASERFESCGAFISALTSPSDVGFFGAASPSTSESRSTSSNAIAQPQGGRELAANGDSRPPCG